MDWQDKLRIYLQQYNLNDFDIDNIIRHVELDLLSPLKNEIMKLRNEKQ